eukprot:Opistho-2@54819
MADEAGVRYFCHACNDTVEVRRGDTGSLACAQCGGEFVEEVEDGSEELENLREPQRGQVNIDDGSQGIALNQFMQNLITMMLRPAGHDGPGAGAAFVGHAHPTEGDAEDGAYNEDGMDAGDDAVPGMPAHVLALLQQIVQPGINAGLSGFGIPPFLNSDPGNYVWGQRSFDEIISRLMEQTAGQGVPPASDDIIASLPTISISKDDTEQGLECAVCKEAFALASTATQLPNCMHKFHADCVIPWLKMHGNCPVCRKDVREGSSAGGASS